VTEQSLTFVLRADAAAARAELGRTGEALRGLDARGRQAAGGMGALSAQTGPLGRGMSSLSTLGRSVADGLQRSGGALGAAASQAQSFLAPVRAMPGAMGLATAGAVALAAGLAAVGTAATAAFAADERQNLVLEQVIRATGGAAGRTERDIDALATAITRTSMATETSVKNAASTLLTFRSISGDTFDRTLRAAQDLAAVGFGSIESASVQLGKALEDPAQGLAALRRVGVSFSEAQRGVIQTLVETGRTAEAQGLILAQIEQQVGGAGAAEGSGLAGAWHKLGQATGDFLEVVGAGIATLTGMENKLRAVASGVDALTGALWIMGGAPRPLQDIEADIERVERALAELGTGAAAGPILPLEDLDEQLDATQEKIRALFLERVNLESAMRSQPGNAFGLDGIDQINAQIQALAEQRRLLFQQRSDVTNVRPVGLGATDADQVQRRIELEAELQALLAQRGPAQDAAAEVERRRAEEQAKIDRERFEGVRDGLIREADEARQSKVERDALNAARRAGVAILSEEGQQIRQLVEERASAASAAEAARMLDTMREQLEIRRAEVAFGKDSAQAAELRAAAERRAFEATLDAKNIAGDLRAELLGAFDAAQSLATTNISGGIAAAASSAAALAQQMLNAAHFAQQLAAVEAATPARPVLGFGGASVGDPSVGDATLGFGNLPTGPVRRNVIDLSPPRIAGGAGGGGGGGAAALSELQQLQERAQAVLMGLGMAMAAVQEKTRAGLLTAVEGADEVVDAKERAANALAELIPQIEAMGPSGKAAVEEYREALAGLVPEIQRVGDAAGEIGRTISDSFGDAFAEFISGTSSAGNAFGGFADLVTREVARMMSQRFVGAFLSPLLNSVFGALPFADGGVPGVTRFADGGVPDLPEAAGDVLREPTRFAAGGLPKLSEFANRIVSRPTHFEMGGGVGEMGEAGPEAILPTASIGGGLGIRAMGPDGSAQIIPLVRIGGKLGVALPDVRRFADGGVPAMAGIRLPSTGAMGGGSDGAATRSGGDVRVTVNNNAAPQAMARVEERQQGGDRIIDVIIEQVEARVAGNMARGVGPVAGAMSGVYGLQRAPR
jgi:hypothetical protein